MTQQIAGSVSGSLVAPTRPYDTDETAFARK
jgi:hypothetical protein